MMNNLQPVELSKDNERILRYAQEKFQKEGFYKTSMDELARELQISKKTIYKYYASKEKLVEHIVLDKMMCDSGKIKNFLNKEDNVVMKFIQILNLNRERFSCMSEKWFRDLQIHTPQLWSEMDKFKIQMIEETMKKLIEQGKKEKLIENYPSEIIIAVMISSIKAILNADFMMNSKLNVKELFHYTMELLLNGMLTEKGKKLYEKEKNNIENQIGKINLSQN
ncbi:MAG: TetR/AcrR family transcriptional regulator [Ignavibacteria bacterium]|nr:TetR/AcrR family transcriptional regulator [Ignavibacteria bacterium]